jgi:hypothetical protein
MASRSSVVVSALSPASNRRRAPRVQLLGELHGRLVGLSLNLVVRDLSEGGFSIESPLQFPVGAKHLFNLAVGPDDSEPVVVEAEVRHSGPIAGVDAKVYVTGLAFTTPQPHATPDAIASVVSLAQAMAEARGESGSERRIVPRLDVLGEMHGEVLSLGVPLRVRDFGLGGCSIDTPAPLEPAAEYTVRLQLTDSLAVSIRARVAHTRREMVKGQPLRFVSGLQFVDPVGHSRDEIADMLGLLTSSSDAG